MEVVTTTSEKYADSFGFTEEVFAALDEYGLAQQKQQVRDWYDGFTFGSRRDTKKTFENLLAGGVLDTQIDEQIVYNQLSTQKNALWSLLLASGYLKVKSYKAYTTEYGDWRQDYELELTNFEVRVMFRAAS